MLQKEFFQVQPFNPSPYWEGTILVNLSGAQKFEEDTVFPAGRYSVDVQAGGFDSGNSRSRAGGRVVKNIIIVQPFIVRAYSGAKTNVSASVLGINPYGGSFKVNGYSAAGVPAMVSHIFGNAGSATHVGSNLFGASSGNCLGNGAIGHSGINYGSAAGSCLHVMPIGGVFGTNYLFAFHTTGGAYQASGSAYGGAASGGASKLLNTSATSSAGGSSPYGSGGAGVTDQAYGNNGTGIGAGRADGVGAAAWFDGSIWADSADVGVATEDGHVVVKYLGSLN